MDFHEFNGTGELYMVKQDMFNGEYVLTDNTKAFGQLIYDGFGRENALIYSWYNNWKLGYDFELLGNTYVLIFDNQDNLLGKVTLAHGYLGGPPYLVMSDGFEATFARKHLFSNTYEWKANQSSSIIEIENTFLSLTNTVTIPEKELSNEKLTLLCFLAQHLLNLKDKTKNTYY
jgi:hypothetical protein